MRRLLLLLAVVALARAELYHVRMRAPTPALAGMAGVQEVAADQRLFLVEAASPALLHEQIVVASGAARGDPTWVVSRVLNVETRAISWGQDRVDQHALPLSGTYTPASYGAGTTAWIVDTGLEAANADFGGRASMDFAFYSPPYDCHGHGTFVSSALGGTAYGIARSVRLRGIKVLNCAGSGTTFGVAQGLLYVLDHLSGKDVINLSLGYTSRDSVVESVIADLLAAGAIVVAAAGNDNANGCGHFPSAQAGVVSVAATDIHDARAYFSDFGSCVTLFAPGVETRAAALGGGSTTMSGTSMASPIAAGIAAQLLETLAPSAVVPALVAQATSSVVTDALGSPNKLAYTPPASSATATSGTSGATSGATSGSGATATSGTATSHATSHHATSKASRTKGHRGHSAASAAALLVTMGLALLPTLALV